MLCELNHNGLEQEGAAMTSATIAQAKAEVLLLVPVQPGKLSTQAIPQVHTSGLNLLCSFFPSSFLVCQKLPHYLPTSIKLH